MRDDGVTETPPHAAPQPLIAVAAGLLRKATMVEWENTAYVQYQFFKLQSH